MRSFFVCLVYIFLATSHLGCSSTTTPRDDQFSSDQSTNLRKNDYVGQLNWFGAGFAKNNYPISLPKAEQNYLKNLIDTIIVANPKIAKGVGPFEIVLMKDREPYHFSLPSGKIFISSELFRTMVDSEGALATVLCSEIVRVSFQMYQKYQLIPQGLFEKEEMVKYFKSSIGERVEHNKWTYYCLENAGFDPSVVLGWIQKQNKLVGSVWFKDDVKTLSLEESLFKSFLINRLKEGLIEQKEFEKSDRRFYKLLNVLRPINDKV